ARKPGGGGRLGVLWGCAISKHCIELATSPSAPWAMCSGVSVERTPSWTGRPEPPPGREGRRNAAVLNPAIVESFAVTCGRTSIVPLVRSLQGLNTMPPMAVFATPLDALLESAPKSWKTLRVSGNERKAFSTFEP